MEKLTKSKELAGSHEKISYTAGGPAYARTFSDIPYSQEIAEICQAGSLPEDNAEAHHLLSPYFEARFKALSNLLKESGAKNILEVASGVSPRGLIMTDDPNIHYIETDLPNKIKEKQQIFERLLQKTGKTMPKNLKQLDLNILDEQRFEEIASEFPPGPIAIAHEGLLAYFNHSEKRKMAEIIKKVLSRHGGVWITPDIFTHDGLSKLSTDKKIKEAQDNIARGTTRNYHENTFKSLEEAKEFFNDSGFDFTIRTLGETAGELASTKIGLDKQSVENQLSLNIWELRVKK